MISSAAWTHFVTILPLCACTGSSAVFPHDRNQLDVPARKFAAAVCNFPAIPCFDETTDLARGRFWDVALATLHDLQCGPVIMTTVTNFITPQFGQFTVTMAFSTFEDVPWLKLSEEVFFKGDNRLAIAILETQHNKSEISAALTSRCTPWTVKGLAMATWYLARDDLWITVVPYPDSGHICEARFSGTDPFRKVGGNPAWLVDDFKGHELAVSTVPYPPYADVKFDKTTFKAVSYSGADFVVLKEASKLLNYTLDVSVSRDEKWGLDRGNGSWSGVIGVVQRREANIGCSALNAFPQYPPVVRYMEPWDEECLTMVTRAAKPIKANIYLTAFDPYPLWFWLTFWLLLFVIASLDYWEREVSGNHLLTWSSVILMYLEGSLGVGAEEWKITKRLIKRLTWMSWIAYTFFVMVAYTTFLVSSLTVPIFEKLPETLQEFLDSPHNYKMIRVRWEDSVDDFLNKSKTETVFDRLWQRLQIEEPSDEWWTYSPMKTVGGERFGLIEMSPDAWLATMLNGPRDFIVSKAKLTCLPIAYATPENDIFGLNMDGILLKLSRFGLLRRLRKVSREGYVPTISLEEEVSAKTKKKSADRDQAIVLGLASMVSIFFVWGVGCSLGLASFVCEVLLGLFSSQAITSRPNQKSRGWGESR